MKKKIILFFWLKIICLNIFAQNIPMHSWRISANYQASKNLIFTPQRIYVQSTNGIFYKPFAENNVFTLSKNDGLSEGVSTALGYDEQNNALMIAYQSGGLEWLQNGQILQNNLIKNLSTALSKNINQIYFYQNKGYICTDFGVVIWDSRLKIIIDTYQNLGINGTNLKINSASISRDSLFLGTEQGVIVGSLNNNLKDFNQWKRFNWATHNLPTQNTNKIITFDNKIYCVQNANLLYRYNHNNTWTSFNLGGNLKNIAAYQNHYLVACNSNQVFLAQNNEIFSNISSPLFLDLQDVKVDGQGKIYVADFQNGLVTNQNNTFQTFFPNSPAYLDNSRIAFGNNQFCITTGGYDNTLNPKLKRLGFFRFENGEWKNFNNSNAQNAINIPNMADLTSLMYSPIQKNWFFGSFGEGILVQKENGSTEIWNASTPSTSLTTDATGRIRITGIATENNGDTWFLQYQPNHSSPYLHVRRNNGTWQGFLATQTEANQGIDLFIDKNGFKWVRLATGGLWVFDDKTNRSRLLLSNSGGLPDNFVNSITQDKDNQIWIGTNRGVGVLFNPNRIFEFSTNFFAPIYQTRPLLRSEIVTKIVVDGGNRKWIATQNGLWLFNPDGTQQLEYWNENNSPLYQNQINDLSLHPETGELFILSDKGIVSYRTNSSEATENFTKISIFPNPVRPDFEGEVGITGVAENSIIKITDVAGRLFYETKANGGTASWNLKDYNNVKAGLGIYLIFCTKPDGSESVVGKIAVVK